MKVSNKRNYSTGDFLLKFKPVSLTFDNPLQQTLKIYLEKNVQVIGQIPQIIKVSSSVPKYIFNQNTQPVEFRLLSTKYADYQITLYKVIDDGREECIGSSPVNFCPFLKKYEEQFKKLDERLQIEMREKVAEALPDLWRGLVLNFSRSKLEATAKFNSLKANLQFTLTPYTEYDELVSLDDIQKLKQKEKEMKINFRRTATLPNFNPKHFSSNKIPGIGSHESEMSELDAVSIDFAKKFKQKKGFSQTERKDIAKSDLIKINQEHEQNEKKSNEKSQLSPLIGQMEMEALDIDAKLEQEELKGNDLMGTLPSWAKQAERTIDPETKKLSQSENLMKNQKQISVGRVHELMIPQTNSPSHLGIISLGSYDTKQVLPTTQSLPQKSKLKQYMVILFTTLLFGMIIYFLMHPIPKTG